MMAKNRRGWAPVWSAIHSHSYGLREDQAQAWLDQPGPGHDSGEHKSRSTVCLD